MPGGAEAEKRTSMKSIRSFFIKTFVRIVDVITVQDELAIDENHVSVARSLCSHCPFRSLSFLRLGDLRMLTHSQSSHSVLPSLLFSQHHTAFLSFFQNRIRSRSALFSRNFGFHFFPLFINTMSSPRTFGIELEFLVIYRPGVFNNTLPNLIPFKNDRYIDKAGLIHPKHAIKYCLNLKGILAEISGRPISATAKYTYWAISSENLSLSKSSKTILSNLNRNNGDYTIANIELSSRILTYEHENWQEELQIVLDTLQEMRTIFACEFLTNASCGLHVHVGGDISLQIAKRIAQLTVSHERNFDHLHSASRILPLQASPAPADDAGDIPINCAGLMFFFASRDFKNELRNSLDCVAKIEKMSFWREFLWLFQGRYKGEKLDGHYASVNFDNLFRMEEFYPESIGTVEFRQFAGTLEKGRMGAWVEVVVALTSFCRDASDGDFVALIAAGVDSGFGAEGLLKVLGCGKGVVEYFCLDPGGVETVVAVDGRLQPLIDCNLREMAVDRELGAVRAVVKKKDEKNLYGFGSRGIGLALGQHEIEEIISAAEAEVDEEADGDRRSRARFLVFESMADSYHGMGNEPICNMRKAKIRH